VFKYQKKITTIVAVCCCLLTMAQDSRRVADSIRLQRRIPGLVYAVVSSDKVLLLEGVGYTKFRTKDTISLTSRFHLGSATGTITSYIAAQLVAKGKLKWNTPLFSVFPSLAAKSLREYKDITFIELLSQQAGLIVLNDPRAITEPIGLHGTNMQQRQQFVEWIIQRRVGRDSSGKKVFRFSNANVAVAAAMMEKASGKAWEDLLKEYFNKPLGVAAKTGWPNNLSPNEPWGHWLEADRYIPVDPKHWYRIPTAFTGAMDANITIGDYIKFIQDELKGLRGEKATLNPRIYELMHYGYPAYGLGWGNLEGNGVHISDCDGTAGTFFSHVEIFKEKNLAVIVLCNSGDTGGKGAAINLARALREMYMSL
jgi:CubicO group peptidase (beta-lactamase class C family)